MGKIVTIYLSNDEARRLQEFCDANKCTQYSALKTAVKQILSEPISRDDGSPQEVLEEPHELVGESQEETVINDDESEESLDQPDEAKPSPPDLRSALLRLHARAQAKK